MSNEDNQQEENKQEENQQTENPQEEHISEQTENNANEKKNISPLLKYSILVLTSFLAIFAATYIVVDLNMHRLGYMPFVVTMEEAQKMFDKEAGFIEKNSPAPVKIEQKDDGVVVTVDLKHFDNDENNVNVSVEDNGIKIDGKVKKEKNGEFSESSFVQSVKFPNKFDKKNVVKTKKGNKLILKLPFED